MSTNRLVLSCCIAIMILIVQSHGNELSVATGINSSFHRGWDGRFGYQATTIPDPVEVAFQKCFSRIAGAFFTLGYSSRTGRSFIEATDIDPGTGTIIFLNETLLFEKRWHYLSLAIGPVVSHAKNRFRISYRAGFEGNFYIAEKTNHFSQLITFSREEDTKPLLFSIMTGAGIGYSINHRTTIGLKSDLSRTITDVVKYAYERSNKSYFLNWRNSLYVSILLWE